MSAGGVAPGRVLVVDDEAHIRAIAATALATVAGHVFQAESAGAALEILGEENIDVVVSDLRMPGMDGLEFLRRVRDEQPAVRFVMITAHGGMDTVIRALRLGAADFLPKPFETSELCAVVSRLLRVLPPRSGENNGRLLGESPAFLQCLETARRAAAAEGAAVLITGESGAGKEGVARFIHETSARRDGPFIPVNCGAVPESLMESELFGHARGAFTGAIADRPGKFALADGGTIFLDEVGEMPPAMQVRLLRVLQERVVEPVGAATTVATDFRLIAATHRDLRAEVRAGRFREDLWFRMHVLPVELPPLRERGDDVLLLARHFLDHFNTRYGAAHVLSAAHGERLLAHAWPGNVRELANAVERAVVLSNPSDLVFQLGGTEEEENNTEAGHTSDWKGDGKRDGKGGGASPVGTSVRDRRRAAEREAIAAALETCDGNKTRAAAQLGISRRGLLYKIKEYGMG